MGAEGSFWGGAASPFLLALAKWSVGLGVVRVCGDGVAVVVGVSVAGGALGWLGFGVSRGQKYRFCTS